MDRPPSDGLPEREEWHDAVENFADDPAVETFERVVEAGEALLAALMPPPDSDAREPSRLLMLIRFWRAQAEALRSAREKASGPGGSGPSRLKDRERWLKPSDVLGWFGLSSRSARRRRW
jgi:hypothetical protein